MSFNPTLTKTGDKKNGSRKRKCFLPKKIIRIQDNDLIDTDIREAESQVCPFKMLKGTETANIVTPSLTKLNQEKTGSRKRKRILLTKVTYVQDYNIFTDLSSTGNDRDVCYFFANEEEINPMKIEYCDNTNKNLSHLFQFDGENVSKEINCSNAINETAMLYKSEDVSKVLTISEPKAYLENSATEDSADANDYQNNSFEIAILSEGDILSNIIDENWDFCKLVMTADANIIHQFPLSTFLEDEGFTMDTNYEQISINAGEFNGSLLSSKQNISFVGNHIVVNEDCRESYDQVFNSMQIVEPLNIYELSLFEDLTQNNMQDLDLQSQAKVYDTGTISDSLNSWEKVMLFGRNIFRDIKKTCYNMEEHTDYGIGNTYSSVASFEYLEAQSTRTHSSNNGSTETKIGKMCTDQNNLDYKDISVETSVDKNEISNQIKIIDTGEQIQILTKSDPILATINCCSINNTDICHAVTLVQSELQSSFTPEEQSKEITNLRNSAEQVEANEKVSDFSKNKVQSKRKRSISTKRKSSRFKKISFKA